MKKIVFWTLMATYTMLVLADGVLTWLNTPDLLMEGNPLVAQFGLGWGALALANIVVLALVFGAGYYSFFVYQPRFNDETTFTRYISQLLFDRPDRFWTGLIPKHGKPYVAMLGEALLYACIVGRVVIVAEWLAVSFSWYWEPWRQWKSACLGHSYLLPACLTALIVFMRWCYRQYRLNREHKKGTD